MPELKNIRVREAKPRDVGLFKKLWRKYMEQQQDLGSPILASDSNLELMTKFFDAYVDPESSVDGVVLFIADVAVIMWGDTGSYFETSYGKTAYGWGIYVESEHRGKGMSKMLYEEMFKRLREKGFEHWTGSLLDGNEAGEKALEDVTDFNYSKERLVWAKF